MKRELKIVLILLVAILSILFGCPVFAENQDIKNYEEDNSALTYQGSWNVYGDSSASAGKYKISNTKDASVSLSFTGTGIKWVSQTQNNAGIAEVILDGKSEGMVDLYSQQTLNQQLVFLKSHLDRGNHTIQIKVTGNKNVSSSGSYVVIDSLKVIDSSDVAPPSAPTEIKIIPSDKQVEIYWAANTTDDFEGYNIYRSTTKDSGFQKINQNLYYNGSSFTDTTVNNGTTYYYYVTAVDSVGNESAPSSTASGLPTLYAGSYEDSDVGISYQGQWYSDADSRFSGSRGYYTNVMNASSSFSFFGTGVKLLSYKFNNGGIAELIFDKGLSTEKTELIDLYSSSPQYGQVIFEKTGLTEGCHTVSIRVTGQKNASSYGTYLYVDSVLVNGTAYQKGSIQENSMTIDYKGVWSTENNSNYSGGSMTNTSRTGAGAEYTFYGSGVSLIGMTSYNRGLMKVAIDDESPMLIDLYSNNDSYQKSLFKLLGLVNGKHVIKIEATGTKFASSSSTVIGIDAINVIEPVTLDKAVAPSDLTASADKGAIILTWTSTGSGTVGYRIYRYRGILFDGIVNKGLVRSEEFTDTGLVPGVQYTYKVSAVDTLGNETALSQSASTVPNSAGVGAGAPIGINILSAGTYEENNASIVYTGSWPQYGDSGASGNTYRYGYNEGSTLNANFKGTGIKWTAIRANSYGRAQVTIDGKVDEIVSLYSAQTEYKQTVYQKMNLANGWHTIEIKI
ncbi:MAG: hypothetical protein Q8942_19415, partial [Bacillota bacterium]|nr:hypothetical protein [Bacillota bacterium]